MLLTVAVGLVIWNYAKERVAVGWRFLVPAARGLIVVAIALIEVNVSLFWILAWVVAWRLCEFPRSLLQWGLALTGVLVVVPLVAGPRKALSFVRLLLFSLVLTVALGSWYVLRHYRHMGLKFARITE